MERHSYLEVYDFETGERSLLKEYEYLIEAPNWLGDGDTLLFNANGKIFQYSIEKGSEVQIDTGACVNCNNDHVPSPDGKWLAISSNQRTDGAFESHVYILPIGGGEPKQITEQTPSFLHGWSADGKMLMYCAFRNGKVDLYEIPVEGGEEIVRTDGIGYNDGPEYAPDNEYVWYNSTRNGLMHAFRMRRDGSEVTQMTHADANQWFPHVSPDGKRVVYLEFRKGDLEPWEHLPDKEVSIWCMNPDGSEPVKLFDLFGGQGTINVNSWSPDSKKIAFVSYKYV